MRVKAVYLTIGLHMAGEKGALGLRIAQTEGAKFWLQVITELKNCGVQEIFIACVDETVLRNLDLVDHPFSLLLTTKYCCDDLRTSGRERPQAVVASRWYADVRGSARLRNLPDGLRKDLGLNGHWPISRRRAATWR